MSPDTHDDLRSAAALVAIAATGSRGDHLQALILGADPDPGRLAAIAAVLAHWLAQVLTETGTEPRQFALQAIADSISAEAAEGTPMTRQPAQPPQEEP